ncbi:hypothetical protein CR51_41960 [Caballeronia megalochromosomata]|jgi:hypothetical protein|nr:hypothetical protein CR51_41960 [Caballeronia megalochromosomata]
MALWEALNEYARLIMNALPPKREAQQGYQSIRNSISTYTSMTNESRKKASSGPTTACAPTDTFGSHAIC